MARFFAVSAAFVFFHAPVYAVIAPPSELLSRQDVGVVRLAVAPAPAIPPTPAPPTQLALSDDTEVLLDGRRCTYKDIPANAVISRLEVDPDRKTLRRIEFKRLK